MRNSVSTARRAVVMAGCAVSAVAVVLSCATSAIPQSEAPAGTVNYTRVDATVACGGATTPDAMAGLKQLGFVSVVNFRTADEPGAEIEASRAAAESAGLKYFHIPFRAPTPADAERFLGVIADTANQPSYVHCASANRVGAMWAIKRVKQDGWDIGRAMAEAETIGLRSDALKDFVRGYVAQ
ncbi:MAG: sulfur transferase domain-containing protein [Acidobacteria bacterium]|nr:sulfur transferase domain-containing protein [Acidobacteriota bacterium]